MALPDIPSTEPSLPAVPGFELLSEVGRGAQGVVYKARQLRHDRVVALKLFSQDNPSPASQLLSVLRRLDAVAALEHTGIVTIYGTGHHDQVPHVVLEYCRAGSLADRLAQGPLPARDAAWLFEQIGRALAAAHERDIVHGNLSTRNVLLAVPPEVDHSAVPFTQLLPRLSDFALATDEARTDQITVRVENERKSRLRHWQKARDVRALAALLKVALTGRDADREDTSAVSVRKLAPGVPRDLAAICDKGLAPVDRPFYSSAGKLAEDLRRFRDGEPVSARPPGLARKTGRWVRRHPILTYLLVWTVATAALLSLGIWYTAWYTAKMKRERDEAVRDRDEAILRPNRLYYVTQLQFALQAVHDDEPKTARQRLDRCQEELRGWEHAYVSRLCDGSQMTLRGHKDVVWVVACSPDGRLAASGDQEGKVKIWDVLTGREVRTFSDHTGAIVHLAFGADSKRVFSVAWKTDQTWEPLIWDAETGAILARSEIVAREGWLVAFTPDGGRLLGKRNGTLAIWDPNTGRPLRTLQGDGDFKENAAFSPDGKRCVATHIHRRGACLWDLETGQLMVKLAQDMERTWCAAFSPDGGRVALGHGDAITIWDATTGKKLQTFQMAGWCVAFAPDGNRLAIEGKSCCVTVLDLQSGRRQTFCGHTDSINSIAFTPDGRRIITGSKDGTVKVWDSEEGQRRLVLTDCRGESHGVAISPDGRRVVSVGDNSGTTGQVPGEVLVWDARSGKLLHRLEHKETVYSVAFRPDGRQFATGHSNHDVRVWDAETGQLLRTLIGGPGFLTLALAYSPDGRRLAAGDAKGNVILFDADTGEEVASYQPTTWVNSLAFSPDGKQLAVYSDHGDVLVLEAATGKLLRAMGGDVRSSKGLAYSPDGRFLAAPGDEPTIQVWDIRTGAEVRVFRGHMGGVRCLTFSQDSKRLVSAGRDHRVMVWDLETGIELLSLGGHRDRVEGLAFSADGKTLVSCSADRTVRIWETGDGILPP
jgi:WD40 repeat protein